MLGVTQQQQQGGVPQGGIMSSNAGTLGESCSDMSALTSIFKPLSPEPPQTVSGISYYLNKHYMTDMTEM